MWTSFIVMLLFTQSICGSSSENRRHKRYLLFTKATQWGVFVTVSIPLHPETTVSVAWFIEANYYNVDNSTYFQPLLGDIDTNQRDQQRNLPQDFLSRSRFYTFIESMLEKQEYPGQPCLLRAICENASSHFLHNGVLGDLIHLILTPSTSMSENDVDDCYYEAEYLGLEDNCQYYHEDCPISPLEMISIEYNKIFL